MQYSQAINHCIVMVVAMPIFISLFTNFILFCSLIFLLKNPVCDPDRVGRMERRNICLRKNIYFNLYLDKHCNDTPSPTITKDCVYYEIVCIGDQPVFLLKKGSDSQWINLNSSGNGTKIIKIGSTKIVTLKIQISSYTSSLSFILIPGTFWSLTCKNKLLELWYK